MASRAAVRDNDSAVRRGRPSQVSDVELLATGEATKAQIAKLFRRDPKTLDRLLYGLIPAGTRRGTTVYSIEEAAGRLVKPGYSIEQYIRRMHHTDLPPLLGKEFWNGLRARQHYEKENGDLWPTSEVQAVFASACADFRMACLLMVDEIEREASLTPRQREVLKRLTDAAIVNAQVALVDRFKDYEPPAESLLPDSSGGIPNGGPPPGYDSLLDAPHYETEGVGLRDDWGDADGDGESGADASGTLDDL